MPVRKRERKRTRTIGTRMMKEEAEKEEGEDDIFYLELLSSITHVSFCRQRPVPTSEPVVGGCSFQAGLAFFQGCRGPCCRDNTRMVRAQLLPAVAAVREKEKAL